MTTPEGATAEDTAAAKPALRWASSEVPLTFEDVWEEFSEHKRLQPCKPATIDQYCFALEPLRRWMLETLGHDSLADLSEVQARTYLAHVKAHGARGTGPVGEGRVFAIRRHLHVFFRWLLERKYVRQNPFANIEIDKPKDKDRLLPELTREHVEQLLAHIDTTSFAGLRDRMLLLFLCDTGLRLSEALSVRVTEELTKDGTVTLLGKGGKERQVGLTPDFRRELRPYLRTREGRLAETDQPESPWLFPNQWGSKLGKRTFQDNLKRYGEQAGIEGVRVSPHTIRHSYALNHMREGRDSLRLMYILGHSTLTMTDVYAGQAARDVRDEMRRSSLLSSLEVPPPKGRRRMSRRRPEGESADPDRG